MLEDKKREYPNDSGVDKDKVRQIPTDSKAQSEHQTGTDVIDEIPIAKSENVENQTVVPEIRKSPSADGVLYRKQDSSEKEFSDTVSDLAAHSSMELLSDTSDFSDRRRYEILSSDAKGDYEEAKRMATPESDQSVASSTLSEGSRKKRKDKSSLRKSKLNESSDGK